MEPMDPGAGAGMLEAGMGMGQPDPMASAAGVVPPAPAPDPVSAAIDLALSLPGQDAIRRVYQLATSAARAKARISAAADKLDARGYHALLSQAPEARYADVLITARRRLDTLAQERRRLNLEAIKARDAQRHAPASLYEIQAGAATAAMEQVAAGTLLFLLLPSELPAELPAEPPTEAPTAGTMTPMPMQAPTNQPLPIPPPAL